MYTGGSPHLINLVGYAAGTLTTLAFVPQVVRSWRSGSTDDLSLPMLVSFSVGNLLWLLYGVAVRSWPVVGANAVTLCLSLALVALKVRHLQRGRGGAS